MKIKFYDKDKCGGLLLSYPENALLFEKELGRFDSRKVFHFNGEYYRVYLYGIINGTPKVELEKISNFNLVDENEVTEADCIVCPVCGNKDPEMSDEMHGDDYIDEYRCPQCGSILRVDRNVQVTFTAWTKQLPDICEVAK